MSESVHEQIAAALESSLAAIRGDGGTNYWYTPDAVKRVVFFEDSQLDRGYQHLILIRPGDETHREFATGQCQAEAELWIVVARQWDNVTRSPYTGSDPQPWTVIDRALRDVLRKLWADVTLGGLVENIVQDSLVIDRARFVAGWVLAEIRLAISYVYARDAP